MRTSITFANFHKRRMHPTTEIDKGNDTGGKKLSIMHDLYVDLLGSLVPGLLTVILGSAAVFLALSTIHAVLFNNKPLVANTLLGDLKAILPSLHWEIATVILVSSYVVGAAFFRQDPKKPDAVSSLYVWMHSRKEERNGLAVQAKKVPPQLNLKAENEKPSFLQCFRSYFYAQSYIRDLDLDTQFPYLYFKCYLKARGLTHLIPLIPWCPNKEDTKGYRTKMFINILKIRLLSLYPHVSRDIIRNEAHVRLATSVWYAATILFYLSLVIITSLLICVFLRGTNSGMGTNWFISMSFTSLLFLFCISMKYHLRKCIHYMRVREVIYVLETVYIAEKMAGASLLSEELVNKKDHECKDCTKMMLNDSKPNSAA